jgi:hypothetical protein
MKLTRHVYTPDLDVHDFIKNRKVFYIVNFRPLFNLMLELSNLRIYKWRDLRY